MTISNTSPTVALDALDNQSISEQISVAKLNKKWDEVIATLNKVKKTQVHNLYVYLELSIAYRNKRDFVNALNTLKAAEEQRLISPWIHDNYARIYFEKKLYRKAMRECHIALQLTENEAERQIISDLFEICKKHFLLEKSKQKSAHADLDLIDASELFDEEYYLSQNKDLDVTVVNALEHFVVFGWKEGRNPNPYFASTWYAKRYSVPVDQNPLLHYLNTGWLLLFDTSPNFCSRKYFETYKAQVRYSGEPLAYFLSVGKRLGHLAFKADFEHGEVRLANEKAPSPTPTDLQLYAEFNGKPNYNGTSLTYHPQHLELHWIIPDFAAGSGGHMTIFRLISYLERFGHSNTVWITGGNLNATAEVAYENIIRNFQFTSAQVKKFSTEFYGVEGDAVIATGWNTVWGALGSSKMKRVFYLVQDYEPAFYPAGSRSLIAEETYRQDLDCICASPWLAQLMTEKYQRWARFFYLSYDSHNYYPKSNEDSSPNTLEIAAYYRPFTDRRAVELLIMGLERLAKQGIVFRVHFFGNHSPVKFDAPFEYVAHGVLSAESLGQLYRNCRVGVSFSVTNYSLIPQEMMACSLPVVELNTECCRAVFPQEVILLADLHPQSIAEKILYLYTHPEFAAQQVKKAHQWISQFTWENAARILETSLVERLNYYGFKAIQPASIQLNTSPEVSVVIPTYNGGELFKRVLDRVLQQKTPWNYEIIVIDSSSTDGSSEYALSKPEVITHIIPQAEFQHGRSRNLGVELARGDYVAFITQDALPVSEDWLYYLIAALKKYPKAAGVFGKHLPWPNASPFMKRDLINHFNGFDKAKICVSRFTDAALYDKADEAWLSFLRFYSDNNSALRKSVWQSIPYPEIEFGEDQAWMKIIIAAGYEKVYSQHGTVYHSHDYDYQSQFNRAYEEFTFFKNEFGLMLEKVNKEVMLTEIHALNNRDVLYANTHLLTETQLQRQLLLNKAYVLGKFSVYMGNHYSSLVEKRELLEHIVAD
jgi:glycosyltransferase involved in cell wall biosynthesis